MFWENFLVECAKIQKSPAVVVEEIGLSNSMPTSWKKGVIPQKKNQEKIAKYFGITVEELMGTKKEPAGDGELDAQIQNIVNMLNVAQKGTRDAVETFLKSGAKKE